MFKILEKLIYIFFYIIILFLIIKIFYNIGVEFDYKNRELYKFFLNTFLGFDFHDRYGYGFHYLQTILISPFLVYKNLVGELSFNGSGFDFNYDYLFNNIILYSGKIISLLSFLVLNYFSYKIIYFFTKNKLFSLLPLIILGSYFTIFDYASLFRVDIPLNTFLIGSLYFSIKYIEKFKIKYLFLFIFFSIFAFIIKYQALTYISELYLLLFLIIILNKKYKQLGLGLGFLIIIFSILNFNYYQLILNLEQRFDSNSPFMKLNDDELINKTYSLFDWFKIEIFPEIYRNLGKELFLFVLFGLILFILISFFRKIKLKYLAILIIPFLINYYSHLFLTYILNERHFLLMYSIITIFSIIGYYFIIEIIFKIKFLEKINKIKYIKSFFTYFLVLFLLYFSFLNLNINFSSFLKENIYNNNILTQIKGNINNNKILFIQDTPIPFGLHYLYKSDVYRNIGNNIYEKNNIYGKNFKIDNKLFLKYNQIILKENIFNKYKDILKDYIIKEKFNFYDEKYFLLQK